MIQEVKIIFPDNWKLVTPPLRHIPQKGNGYRIDYANLSYWVETLVFDTNGFVYVLMECNTDDVKKQVLLLQLAVHPSALSEITLKIHHTERQVKLPTIPSEDDIIFIKERVGFDVYKVNRGIEVAFDKSEKITNLTHLGQFYDAMDYFKKLDSRVFQ